MSDLSIVLVISALVFIVYLVGTWVGANIGTLDYPPRRRP